MRVARFQRTAAAATAATLDGREDGPKPPPIAGSPTPHPYVGAPRMPPDVPASRPNIESTRIATATNAASPSSSTSALVRTSPPPRGATPPSQCTSRPTQQSPRLAPARTSPRRWRSAAPPLSDRPPAPPRQAARRPPPVVASLGHGAPASPGRPAKNLQLREDAPREHYNAVPECQTYPCGPRTATRRNIHRRNKRMHLTRHHVQQQESTTPTHDKQTTRPIINSNHFQNRAINMDFTSAKT